MKCVILAGGLGTRVQKISPALPKSLIPIHRRPFIDHQLHLLRKNQVNEVILCIGHRGSLIREFVGDGSAWETRVSYVDEGKALRGTGGALRNAVDSGALDGKFMVLYGDSYLPVNFRDIWDHHERCGEATLMTVHNNFGRWDRSNIIFENGRIVLYDKSPDEESRKRMTYIDYGLSVLDAGVVKQNIPENGRADLSQVYRSLSQTGRLAAFQVFERFYEIGSQEGLNAFRDYIARQEPLKKP